jgi:hypothetical protein
MVAINGTETDTGKLLRKIVEMELCYLIRLLGPEIRK